jgi:integrase
LDTVAKEDFRAYRDDLWELVEKKGLKRSHANRRIRIIRAAFRRAYKECNEMLNGEAIQAMLSVLETRQERDTVGAAAIEPSEFHAIAEGGDLQWKTIMYLAMNCALGNTDIASIERRHIDLDLGRISFARVKTAESADRQRHTPLWPETLILLREHMALSRSQRLLFTTVRGDAWVRADTRSTNDELSKKFKKICKRLGISRKGLSFYSIRHAAAEWAADTAGVDSLGIKFLLGHATPEMWGKYVTKTPERLRLAVEGIHQMLFNHPGSRESSVSDATASAAEPGPDHPAVGNPGSTDKPEATPG